MTKDNYTSLEFARKLRGAGCKLKSDYEHISVENKYSFVIDNFFEKAGSWKEECSRSQDVSLYPAYDILNDICVKYAKEFFGEEVITMPPNHSNLKAYIYYPREILAYLFHGKKQEAEDYIWGKCLFNPKNHA